MEDETTFKLAVPALVAMLSGTGKHKEKAASALAPISSCKANGAEIVKRGELIPSLSCYVVRTFVDALAQLTWRDASNSLVIGQTDVVDLLPEILQGDGNCEQKDRKIWLTRK